MRINRKCLPQYLEHDVQFINDFIVVDDISAITPVNTAREIGLISYPKCQWECDSYDTTRFFPLDCLDILSSCLLWTKLECVQSLMPNRAGERSNA